jgi:hypothetical protein
MEAKKSSTKCVILTDCSAKQRSRNQTGTNFNPKIRGGQRLKAKAETGVCGMGIEEQSNERVKVLNRRKLRQLRENAGSKMEAEIS